MARFGGRAYLCRALQEPPKVCLSLRRLLLLWFCDELGLWTGGVFTLSGADVGENEGVVWMNVAARMSRTGEAVNRSVDEWGRGVVTKPFSKMSFCAPFPKLYKSRYNGGE